MIVVAFERFRIIEAIEFPDSPKQRRLPHSSHPTVWNQTEAAMAYAGGLPILVIVAKGLRQEAMLRDRPEWRALESDMSPNFFKSPEFQQGFGQWLDKVVQSRKARDAAEDHSKNSNSVDVKNITVGDIFELIKRLSPSQVCSIVGAFSAILFVVATAGYHLGKLAH